MEYWENDNSVEILYLLDDINQPYSCQHWGDRGVMDQPIIINDGSANIIHDWFDNDNGYPDNIFIDHDMKLYHHEEGYLTPDAINTIIQDMVDLRPPCEDPIAPNFNEPGQCDYTDLFTSYENDIQPIFDNNCTQCHGNSGGLSLANYDSLMSSSVVISNNGENSIIYQRMTSSTSPMPPTGLIDSYLAERIKVWIDQGALECTQGEDCAGTCGGTTVVDECGTCDSDPSNDCVQDCNGDWGGNYTEDSCGVCDSEASNDNTPLTGTCDCNATPDGEAYLDGCSECVGGTTLLVECLEDCAGVAGGTASFDNCNNCICNGQDPLSGSGCMEIEPCVQDCALIWGGDDSSCLSIIDNIPEKFSINNIYPNPFNPVVNIEYSLATSDLINIGIYDLNGQMIDQLFSNHQSVGNYQITWEASGMSSGIYIIMIQSGNIILSDQLVLLK